jgi:hypothetical protein
MSREKIVRTVAGRLSLREPQSVSLERLHNALESVPALCDSKARSAEELTAMLAALKAEFPTLTDFERDFPSLCFALATGVGKTRLTLAMCVRMTPRRTCLLLSKASASSVRTRLPGAKSGASRRLTAPAQLYCFQRSIEYDGNNEARQTHRR